MNAPDGDFFARAKVLGAFRREQLGEQPAFRPLAEKAGASRTTISNWLEGKNFPDDAGQFLAVVAAIEAEARVRGIAVPDGLLDESWWHAAFEAEASRRRDDASKKAEGWRADRALGTLPGPARPGFPLAEVTDPFALEVHRPLEAEGPHRDLPVLPPYITREHDAKLARVIEAAKNGRSGVAVLIGGSSTGKTRACWETIQTLNAPNAEWALWHPIAPTRTDAALRDIKNVAPRTVIWLNEAQIYLDTLDGERVAAHLRELLRDAQHAPVLILATLWHEQWSTLTARPQDSGPDPHAQARELLTGHGITVPRAFTDAQLRDLAEASDPRLLQAKDFAPNGEITQFLAGAPELLSRYETASAAERALITAAMDARRLGMGVAIPKSFLEKAAPAYLTDTEWNSVARDKAWQDKALQRTGEPSKGVLGPLSLICPRPGEEPADGERYRLADYLDQRGRRSRRADFPPEGFWTGCESLADPAEIRILGNAADNRGLLRQAARLHKRAAEQGDAAAALLLIEGLHALSPNEGSSAWHLAENVTLGDPDALAHLLWLLRGIGAHDQLSALLSRGPAEHVDLIDSEGIALLLEVLQKIGAEEQVDSLLARDPAAYTAINLGATQLFGQLMLQGKTGQAARLARRIATEGVVYAPYVAVKLLEMLQWNDLGPDFLGLLTRNLAERVPLDGPRTIAEALLHLHSARADDEFAVLLARDPAVHVAVDDLSAIRSLAAVLSAAGAKEQAAILIDRAVAHARPDDPGSIIMLVSGLKIAEAREQEKRVLANDPASRVAIDDPKAVAKLLYHLRRADSQEQTAALLTRDPAANAVLDDLSAVGDLLRSLQKTGSVDQVSTLTSRIVTEAVLGDFWGARELLGTLRETEEEDQAEVIVSRLPSAGLFHLFLEQQGDPIMSRFGREPDGNPAKPWGWENLR